MAEIIDLKPDLIVTAAFGQFLPEELLQSASIGAINVHASLLPKYRGGAPVHHAIMNGDTKTGVTIIEMVKKMDAGTMWAQREIPIEMTDNVGTMFDKLSVLGRTLLLDILPSYIAGELKGEEQDEALVSITPNITASQELINWQNSAFTIYNQIRGLYPWPVAHTIWKNERLKIQKVSIIDENTDALPGTIVKKDKKELLVATDNGLIAIKELQPFGKAPMSITSFLNGLGQKLKVGDRFGE